MMNSSRSRGPEEKSHGISKGDRISLSELGRSHHPRYTGREGTVIGYSVYPSSLRIIWDELRTPVAIHRNYLQRVEEASSVADGN
jgi:hypothetical protein